MLLNAHSVSGCQHYMTCIKLYVFKAEKIDVFCLLVYKTICQGKRVPYFFWGGREVSCLTLETKPKKLTMHKSCREQDSVFSL